MFKINLQKLTPFDTQVIALITIAPDKWILGSAPRLVAYHIDFGWFRSSWPFIWWGAQPRDRDNSNKQRRLSWRGQILFRLKVREILRSAVNPDVKAVTQAPGVDFATRPSVTQAQMPASAYAQRTAALPAQVGQKISAPSSLVHFRPLEPQQQARPPTLFGLTEAQLRSQGAPSHLCDAFKYMAVLPNGPVPKETEQLAKWITENLN